MREMLFFLNSTLCFFHDFVTRIGGIVVAPKSTLQRLSDGHPGGLVDIMLLMGMEMGAG
jgi:hypothetical protein